MGAECLDHGQHPTSPTRKEKGRLSRRPLRGTSPKNQAAATSLQANRPNKMRLSIDTKRRGEPSPLVTGYFA